MENALLTVYCCAPTANSSGAEKVEEVKNQDGEESWMGRLFQRYISRREEIYTCSACGCHLSAKSLIISKSFHGRGGRAFLMEEVVNVYLGPDETR